MDDRVIRSVESLRQPEAPGPVELVIYEKTEDIHREWEQLGYRMEAPPFMRRGWYDAMIEAFDPEGFRIVAARRDGRLVGVMPVVAARGALASATNFHTPIYMPLVEDLDTLRELIAGALSLRRGGLDLDYVPMAGATAAVLRDLAGERGLRSIEAETARQPYVDTSGCWDEYLASLARKHRKEVGRLRRRLEELGELELQFEETSCEVLEEGLAIEGSGWKSDEGSAILSCERTTTFYRRVAEWARAHGWLKLAVLRLDGRAIAFDMCLETAGAVHALKGGFDPELRKFGPGTVLTYESLARAFAADDIKSYEFLGTDEPYKLAWTQAKRPLGRIQVFAPTPSGAARYVARRHLRPAAKRAALFVGLAG